MAYRALVVMGLACCAGCGGSKTYPVQGKLAWADGSPATEMVGGSVVFESEEQPLNARSEIQADASFRLSTYRPHDGAPPGRYKVVVFQAAEEGNDGMPKKKILHERFGNLETSGLHATVETKANDITLTLERAPARKR